MTVFNKINFCNLNIKTKFLFFNNKILNFLSKFLFKIKFLKKITSNYLNFFRIFFKQDLDFLIKFFLENIYYVYLFNL